MAAAPFVGKQAAEDAAMQLTRGVGLGGGAGTVYCIPNNGKRTPKDFARAFLDPKFRSAMEEASFRSNRHVSCIDHDLASKKSFSLAAKITYQRQRNVERELRNYTEQNFHYWEVIENYFNPFGMKS